MATMTRGTENHFQSRRGLYTPLELGFQSVHRKERQSDRSGSRRGRMDTCHRRRTSYDEAHWQKRNHRSRHGFIGYGISPSRTAEVCRKRIHGRGCIDRRKPCRTCHGKRTCRSSRNRKTSKDGERRKVNINPLK